MSGIASSVSWTTAANAGSYNDNTAGAYHIYYNGPHYEHRLEPAYPWSEEPRYRGGLDRSWREYPRIVEIPAPDPQNDRKENDMIERQTFLDALADEGKTIPPEARDLVRDAANDKWRLFVARLLARLVKSADFETLKEKPKEVLIKEA